MKAIPSQLIDARNWSEFEPILLQKFGVENQLNGFDLETEDSRRHEGLNRAMKVDNEGFKGSATKLMFDVERTTITGFSLYADKDSVAYYFNLNHADVENRLPFEKVLPLLTLAKEKGYFVAHKAPFELTMMHKVYGFDLGQKVLCTLQLAVTCFNDDTYPMDEFLKPGLGEGFKRLIPQINQLYSYLTPGDPLSNEQEELLFKFIAKESVAEHSYSGYVASIKYGYGLKRLTKRFLDYEQVTFEQVLGDKSHMGQLTGQEVCSYGADDSWTCVHLFHKLMEYLTNTNPAAVQTYFSQENPMIHVYSRVWREGVKTNRDKVLEGQKLERANVANLLREMKATIRKLLPFPADIHEKLVKYDPKGYGKPGTAEKYRRIVTEWAMSPDSSDDFTQLMQARTAISKEWAESRGVPESSGPSITYYQVVRCLMYDLCRTSFQLLDGKIQSDKEAQDRARSRWVKAKALTKEQELEDPVIQLLDAYKDLSSSNQVIKLYINNYLNMIDPETHRVYPILSSQLNSRRMALESPNLSQLAKNSAIDYVRGYFEADGPDHVLVSADWSGVELVLIGEASGDPEFARVFGQLPHGDLHTGTTVDLLSATEKYKDLTLATFKDLPDWKKQRTDVGKGGNFGYWYSGALGTVAREIGLSSEEMWTMVDKYRTRFAVGEAWRVGVIEECKLNGFVQLPDKNIRYRFESTPMWAMYMRQKFAQYGDAAMKFGEIAIRKIQARSGNQAVNSIVQGTCATLAKRSILAMDKIIEDKGYEANFKFPVHDELVYSVHRKHAVAFMGDLWQAMCYHPDIVKSLKLDAAMAVGLNYWAHNKDKNPKGQCELDEASKLPCIPEERWGKKLNPQERQQVVDWLFA